MSRHCTFPIVFVSMAAVVGRGTGSSSPCEVDQTRREAADQATLQAFSSHFLFRSGPVEAMTLPVAKMRKLVRPHVLVRARGTSIVPQCDHIEAIASGEERLAQIDL